MVIWCLSINFSHSSDLILTCSKEEIRIWSTKTNQEIVRITVPNMTCNAIDIMRCGTSIISGKDLRQNQDFVADLGTGQSII